MHSLPLIESKNEAEEVTCIQPFRGEDIAKAAGCAKSTANLAMHKARAAVAAEADAAGTGDTGATAGAVAAGGKKDNVKGTVKVKKEEQEEDDKSTQAPPDHADQETKPRRQCRRLVGEEEEEHGRYRFRLPLDLCEYQRKEAKHG